MKKNTENLTKKKFKLFDPNRDGKGVYEQENRKPNLKFFFVLTKRKFTQLLQLNLLMLFMIIPFIVILCIYMLGTKTPSLTDPLFVPLQGIETITPSPSLSALTDLVGTQMELPVLNPAMMITIVGMILFLAITWGWQNVGAAYVLRGLFRGDPIFVFSDYFYAIRRNLKQSFFLGLIDFICSAVLIIDFIFFYYRTGSFGNDVMYFMIFALILIYLVMRFYLYQLLITFDLSVFKIIKNALIFSILGIKRNVMGLLGIILLLAIHILLIVIFIPMGVSIPLVLPCVYIFALLAFISVYSAFPIIDRYMIAPYQQNTESLSDEE